MIRKTDITDMSENYEQSENKSMNLAEPAVAYQQTKATDKTMDWNPNQPVHATQEEWWEHIRQIEQGKFYTKEEYEKLWKKRKMEILANHIK